MMNKTVPHSEAAALGTRVPIPTRPPLEPGPIPTRVLYQRQAPPTGPSMALHSPLLAPRAAEPPRPTRLPCVCVAAVGPSVVGGGGTSQWRKSYSVNMQPDFDDESHIFTQAYNPSTTLTQPQHNSNTTLTQL